MASPCQAMPDQEDATPPTPRSSYLPDTVSLELWQTFSLAPPSFRPGSPCPAATKYQAGAYPCLDLRPLFHLSHHRGSSTLPLCPKPVSKEGLLKYDYRGHRCPTVIRWHLWCDESFTPAKDPAFNKNRVSSEGRMGLCDSSPDITPCRLSCHYWHCCRTLDARRCCGLWNLYPCARNGRVSCHPLSF